MDSLKETIWHHCAPVAFSRVFQIVGSCNQFHLKVGYLYWVISYCRYLF